MRTTRSRSTILASVAGILALSAPPAAAAVPDPTINGVVVEDVTRSFSFDRVGEQMDTGPFVVEDAYQGTVRTIVIRALDNTYDFYFRITPTTAPLRTFEFSWQAATSYTVAYHATDPEMLFLPAGPARPTPGTSETGAVGLQANWSGADNIDTGGLLMEGVLLLDTDAKAYSRTATYRLGDSIDRLVGNYRGESADFVAFGPAVPEPQTWALILVGLGLVTLVDRRRRSGST
jgi:hypothetical protein